MPTINIDKRNFLELIGKHLPDSELLEKIPMIGVDLESIDQDNIVVEIFPNRPDLLSDQGFARAFSSFIGINKGLKKYHAAESNYVVEVDDTVNEVRPYTACAVIKGLKLNEEKIKEIITIQEKLHITYGRNRKKCAIGVYPLEKIKFPITYTAKKPEQIKFMPLEYNEELDGNEILEKHNTGKEYAHLLKDKSMYPIFIDANSKILSMPPIINSHDVGKISKTTTEAFIEVSGFDFEYISKCLNMIVCCFIDMGGKAFHVKVKYGKDNKITPELNTTSIKINEDYVNKILGLELKKTDMKKLLENMGYDYTDDKVIIPCYRADILHQVDIIEDIAIAYGYENFEPTLPNISTIGEENKTEAFKNKIRDILTNSGLIEVKNFSLQNYELQKKYSANVKEIIQLKSSVSELHNSLRASLLLSLMKNFEDNKINDYPQNIFECGTCFKLIKNEVVESEKLSIGIAAKLADFTRIKQSLDYLFNKLDINYSLKEAKDENFIEGRVGNIIINDENVGVVGELHPKLLEEFSLTVPIAILELDIKKIINK